MARSSKQFADQMKGEEMPEMIVVTMVKWTVMYNDLMVVGCGLHRNPQLAMYNKKINIKAASNCFGTNIIQTFSKSVSPCLEAEQR